MRIQKNGPTAIPAVESDNEAVPILVPLFPEEWRELARELRLSPRELEIVQLLCTGAPAAVISQLLGISINTVHTHMSRMHCKLKVNSSVGIIARIFGVYIDMSRANEPQSWRQSATG
jgi:DNA-binding CsgD family transcriptional regulator